MPEEYLSYGDEFYSPGHSYKYKIVGMCCRLYDREELPWPSCSLQWKGKQPSWKRVGCRFVADMATKWSPSYSVIDQYGKSQIITLYWKRLSDEDRKWWVTPKSQNINNFWN